MRTYIVVKKAVVLTVFCLFLIASFSPIMGKVIRTEKKEINQNILSHELSIEIPDFNFKTRTINDVDYAYLEFEGEGFSEQIGNAQLPMIRRMVQIPYGAEPSLEILFIKWDEFLLEDLKLPDRIIPKQAPIEKTKEAIDTSEFVINKDYYETDNFVPLRYAEIKDVNEIRGHRYAFIEIAGVLYNPASSEIKVIKDIEIKLNLPGADIKTTSDMIERYHSDTFEGIFDSTFINYDDYKKYNPQTRDPEGYLIICYSSFASQIQPFVDWKITQGFDVTLTLTSDIPGGASYTNIENYIDSFYASNPNLVYILLAGDTGQVPTKTTGLESYVDCSDLYYADTSGNYFPELIIGRFPAATANQLTSMVDKTLYFEQGSYSSFEWLTSAAFIASNDAGGLAEDTHNYVINTHLAPNQWLCDTIYEASGGSTSDITNSLNDGRILCIYSGHGSPSGWGCVPFYQSNVNSLNNFEMYPFVGSHACSTNTFDDAECFGETWLRAQNKGGIVFYGASASTYWDEDDWLERNYFDAWWFDGIEAVGGFTVQGMIDTVADIGGPYTGRSQYYFEAYNLHGDPSLELQAEEFVWEDDVGVTDITNPSETFDEGPTTITATIHNFGINNQIDVPVNCNVYPGGEVIYFEDFEDDNGGYSSGGTSTWQWGIPTYYDGPSSAHSGSKCWGTNLNGEYPDSCNGYVDTGQISLPTGSPAELTIWNWYKIESVSYDTAWDGADVEISVNSGPWNQITPIEGYDDAIYGSSNAAFSEGTPVFSHNSGGWQQKTFDLTSYAGQNVNIRFRLGTDGSVTEPGYYVDDIQIQTLYESTPVYTSSTTLDINSEEYVDVDFTPQWIAEPGNYIIVAETAMIDDQKSSNDQWTKLITVEESPGFILNLIDFPMYVASGGDSNYAGPAVAKMTLDYLAWDQIANPDGCPSVFNQNDLYTQGLSYNADPELDVFDLQGMHQVIQNNRPGTYQECGYNFLARQNTDLDYMLGQICKWMAYDVDEDGTVGFLEGHPHHVPSVIPSQGNYDNWIVVRGIHTDVEPYPLPDELVVNGFWLNDPDPAAFQENYYASVSDFVSNYYDPMTTGDAWDGKYVAILEPPEEDPDVEVIYAQPRPQFNSLQARFAKLAFANKGLRQYAIPLIKQAAVNGVTEELVPYDADFAELFETMIPQEPVFVKNSRGDDFFAVPFSASPRYPSPDIQVIVLVKASDGSFMEVSWTDEPSVFLEVSRQGAVDIATSVLEELGEVVTGLEPSLIYRNNSPFYPEWMVVSENYQIYISQDGSFEYIKVK